MTKPRLVTKLSIMLVAISIFYGVGNPFYRILMNAESERSMYFGTYDLVFCWAIISLISMIHYLDYVKK